MARAATRRSAGWLALVATFSTAAQVAHADPQSPGLKMYDEVKNVENQIKSFPKKAGKVHVGTLNVATKRFIGYYTPEDIEDSGHEPGSGPVQKPKYKHFEPVAIPIDAVEVTLTFSVSQYNGPWSVVANGKKVNVPAGQSKAEVFVGAAVDVSWSITTSKFAEASRGRIARPSVGAGAFIIPAMPVTVLYEPPMDSRKKTFAEYTSTKSVGTAVTASFSEESSEKKADPLLQFQGGNEFKSITGQAASLLSSIDTPYTKAVGIICKIASAGMDSVTSTLETGTKVTNDHAVQLGLSQTNKFTTGATTGPGHGDRLFYLKNARAAWIVTQAKGEAPKMSLALLGYDALANATVDVLKEDLQKLGPNPGKNKAPTTGLPVDAIQALLELDPFAVKGPNADLDAKRFALVDEYETHSHGDNPDTYELSTSKVTVDTSAKVSFSIRTTEYSQGFWTALGFGDPTFENKTAILKTTQTNIEQNTSAYNTTAKLNMFAAVDEDFSIRVFYDRVFGTFAFKKVSTGPERIGGIALGPNGKPLVRGIVTLKIGDKSFTTRTDENGRYSFRSTAIPNRSAATLHVEGKLTALQTQ